MVIYKSSVNLYAYKGISIDIVSFSYSHTHKISIDYHKTQLVITLYLVGTMKFVVNLLLISCCCFVSLVISSDLTTTKDSEIVTIIVNSTQYQMTEGPSCFQQDEDIEQVYICCNLSDGLDMIENKTAGKGFELIIEKEHNFLTHKYVSFSQRSSIKIRGQTPSVTINCSESYFEFVSIPNLQIYNLNLVNCGLANSPAVMTNCCQSVELVKLNVTKSPSFGVIVLNSIYTLINDSFFISNGQFSHEFITLKVNEKTEKLMAGGGLTIIHHNSCKETNCNSNAHYTIVNCTFKYNKKSIFNESSESMHYYDDNGNGGGLHVILLEACFVAVTVHNSFFISNEAKNGGGSFVVVYYCRNVLISFYNTSFHANIASSSKALMSKGGGLRIELASRYKNNTINVTKCLFTDNIAYFGGGLGINCGFSYYDNTVLLKDSKWIGNTASSGSAVDINRHFPKVISTLQTFKPIFVNCTFTNNTVTSQRHLSAVGNGALSIIKVNVNFTSHITFDGNIGSAMSVTWATVTFISCRAIFNNNTSINGGAVSLNFARLFLYRHPQNITFIGNKAVKYGGAVYLQITDDHMLVTKASCPFVFSCSNINKCPPQIFFKNNIADRGNSIYIPSLIPCQKLYTYKDKKLIKAKSVFKKQPFVFSSGDDGEIATAPSWITLRNYSLSVYPGETLPLDLKVTDELNNSIPNNMTIFELSNPYYIKDTTPLTEIATIKDFYIYNYTITVVGPVHTSSSLYIQTTVKPILAFNLTLHTKGCPPGYVYNNKLRQCLCEVRLFYGIRECHPSDFSSMIIRGSWCGYVQNKTTNKSSINVTTTNNSSSSAVFVSGPCFWFCNIVGENHIIIPWNLQEQDSSNTFLCRRHRLGTLCGECQLNYTTYYHSNFKCGPVHEDKCKWGWLLFITSEILPITLLFIFITVTGLNVTSGYIQGFLLYSHILCTLCTFRSIQMGFAERYFYDSFLHFFYFPLTLKFFYFSKFSFCIAPDMNGLDIVSLRYVKGVYSLILILIVVAFLKCFASYCHGCNRWLRFTTAKTSTLIGMSALYVLSFTSAVEVSLIILQPAPLYSEGYKVYSTRVALYGEMEYFGSRHIPYAVLAIVCLVVLLIPTVMLLTYPLLSRCLSYCHLDADRSVIGFLLTKGYMYTQLMPFYDMFYASFKDNQRHFAGIYFVYRMTIQLSYYLPNYIEACFVMEGLLISFLIIHALVQPYQRRSDNIIDGLFFSNLVLLNGLTCANAVTILESKHGYHFWKPEIASFIQLVLSILPMCIVLGFLIWKYLCVYLCRKFNEECTDNEESLYLLQNSSSLEHRRNVLLHDRSN